MSLMPLLPFARSIRAMPAVMPVRTGEITTDAFEPAVMPSRSRNETGDLASILNSLRNQGIGQADYESGGMTYDQAIARNMQRDMKLPEEQAQIDAAIAAGPMQTQDTRAIGPLEGRAQFGVEQRIGESDEDYNIRSGLVRDPNRRPSNPFLDILSGLGRAPAQPANPFEGNEQYQALMEYQQSLAPNQEQQQRLQELRSAFEGTGAFKDYRINQLQQQMRQVQQRQNPMMGMGLGSMRPMGMQPYQGFGRPQFPMQMPMQQPINQIGYNQPLGYNQPQPMQQPMMGGYGMSPYQQMRPQPQQFGGYGMGQQMGGYGGYGGMSNPYQPQQFGYNPNNFMGYGQQQMNQFQGYMR